MNSIKLNHEQGAVRLLAVITLVLVIAAVGLFVATQFFLPPAYRKTGNTFMAALEKNDATTTYNMFTARGKLQVGSASDWQSQVNSSFGSSHVTSKFASDVSLANDTSTYPAGSSPHKLIYNLNGFSSGGSWQMYIIVLKDTSGTWKVDEVSSYLK